MVYLVYGNDTARSHKELNKLVAQFLKEENNLAVFRVDDESFSESIFSELLKTENLFSTKKLVVSKRLFAESSSAGYVLDNLEKFTFSPSIFLFWEETIRSDFLKLLKKKMDNIREFSLAETEKKIFFGNNNIFRITDSFLQRQKEKTWFLCQEAFLRGIPAEDVFWKIVWQVKNLLSVKRGGGVSLHPFVYQKTKKSVSNFNEEELQKYSIELVDLYHKSRLGKKDIMIGLERIILKL